MGSLTARKGREEAVEVHFYVYAYVRKAPGKGRSYYRYERTCGNERAARERVAELGPGAVYLAGHLIRGAFY